MQNNEIEEHPVQEKIFQTHIFVTIPSLLLSAITVMG